MEDLDKKKDLVTDRLQRRDEERIADAKQRKSERDAQTATNETIQFFTENFTKSRKNIEAELDRSSTITSNAQDVVVHFDSVTLLLQQMQKFVTDSAAFLTSREVRNSQNVLAELQSAIQAKREEMIPKKKFAFRAKKKEQLSEKPKESSVVSTQKVITVDISECNFANKTNEQLCMAADKVTDRDVALRALTNCTVKLYGSPSAIHMDKLTNCTVLGGPVSGSIFIDECVDCVFVLACQQLRIHNTTKTNFYIHVTSRAIIEDCSSVHFGPYSWRYDGIEKHYDASRLIKSTNNWSDVDDFNWLASDQKSPNWDIIPEHEWIYEWK